MIKVLIPLARGFEEAEFIGIADVLKRATKITNRLSVLIASLDSEKLVCGANGISIKADFELSEIDTSDLDAIALPGGFDGMMNLKNNPKIIDIIKSLHAQKKLVSAICASPIVLNHAGVLSGEFACYPGCEAGLNGTRKNQAVVLNDNVLTGAGPGVAILFGLEIVRYLLGDEIYQSLYGEFLIPLTK